MVESGQAGVDALERQRFLSLFLRSEREIFRYVAALVPNASDSEDIVQQTAIALWEKFDAYDSSRPFTPWACRFALNKARQWIQRHKRWQALLEKGLADEIVSRREALKPQLERRLCSLERCLETLPEEKRSLIERYYYKRESVESLAQATGRSVEATYKALQRVRQSLQMCIEGMARTEGAG